MTSPADFHLDTGAMALGALPDDELAAGAGAPGDLRVLHRRTGRLPGNRCHAGRRVRGDSAGVVTPLDHGADCGDAAAAAVGDADRVDGRRLLPSRPGTGRRPRPTADLPDNVVPIRRWFRRPGALIAAAIAAVVIGGGAVVAINQAGGPGTQVAQTPEECIAQAADKLQVTPARGRAGAAVTYAASCSAVTLDVTGLPDLPDNQTYQLWALKGDQARSLDVLPDASAGQPQLVTKTHPAGGERGGDHRRTRGWIGPADIADRLAGQPDVAASAPASAGPRSGGPSAGAGWAPRRAGPARPWGRARTRR